MLKKLMVTAVLLTSVASFPVHAAVVLDLGINPTSGTGRFSETIPVTGSFDDQITFQLVGGPQFLTIASVTNVFPNLSDFITGFTGEVVAGTPALPTGIVIGPVAATDNCGVDCQGFGGDAILPAGSYFLDLSGTAGGTSGYGGDLAVAAVPEASTWAMLLIGFLGVGFISYRQRRFA
jgi:hypothetical protein